MEADPTVTTPAAGIDTQPTAPRPPARGLSLFSGGLDSMLAVCVLRDQGCLVEGIVFSSPCFNLDTATRSARVLELTLHVVDFTADITALLEHPPHGFGQAMNPCIDCHAWMIRRAGEAVRARGWDFVATGEVLNQRPMSQNRRSLDQVAQDSGCADILVRPLSAQLLAPSQPEREGRIDRSRLLKLSGRSRQGQLALAAHYGIREYPTSAGGCLLTERMFCVKLQDLQTHEGLATPRDLERLKLGRHFRLPDGAKCIVGRNQAENAQLQAGLADGETLLRPLSAPGPTVIVSVGAAPADEERAAGVCAGYSDNRDEPVRLLRVHGAERSERLVVPLTRETARDWLVVA